VSVEAVGRGPAWRFANGPFDHEQNFSRYSLFGKIVLDPTDASRLVLCAGGFASDWDASGQVPLREVSAGHLDRFGAIDPTEGGQTDRQNVNLQYAYAPTEADELTLQAYASRYSFRLYSNFTFFQDTGLRFVRESDGRICDTSREACTGSDYLPGDGIDQDDARWLFGTRARYRRDWSVGQVPMRSQVGLETVYLNHIASVRI
jgi:hypothetical protein